MNNGAPQILKRPVLALYGDDIIELIERVKEDHPSLEKRVAESIERHGRNIMRENAEAEDTEF